MPLSHTLGNEPLGHTPNLLSSGWNDHDRIKTQASPPKGPENPCHGSPQVFHAIFLSITSVTQSNQTKHASSYSPRPASLKLRYSGVSDCQSMFFLAFRTRTRSEGIEYDKRQNAQLQCRFGPGVRGWSALVCVDVGASQG